MCLEVEKNFDAMKLKLDSSEVPPRQAMPRRVRVGFDLVQTSEVAASICCFGDAYTARLFTPDELDYAAQGSGQFAQRLAARFAAKEAVIKALNLGEAGVGWGEIEVRKLPDGDCGLTLHGRVAALARRMGATDLCLSLSHDGDYAGAFVVALIDDSNGKGVLNYVDTIART